MPGLTLGDHAIPILLILKMSVLRKAIFFTMEAGFKFALIGHSRSDDSHDRFPFCKSSCSWFLWILYHSISSLSFNLWYNYFVIWVSLSKSINEKPVY